MIRVRLGDPVELRNARWAVSVAFAAAGFTFANWAARIPQVRDALDLSPRELGLLLLTSAVGSVLALPSAGIVVHRWGATLTIRAMALLAAIGLAMVAFGVLVSVVPVAIGLFLVGLGVAAWDVAMNVEGAAVERTLGRDIMSRFHAGWSLGTVLGALVGAGMNALDVALTPHLLGITVLMLVVVWAATRAFVPAGHESHAARAQSTRHPLTAWTEPRTLLIGVMVLAWAFTEGTGNDWLAIAAIDGHGATATQGSLAFGVFVAAMTIARWFGPTALARWGRVVALRASAVIALVGLAAVVLGDGLVMALAGAALWGLGTALGFPVGMSAAADEPEHAAGRVSVVSSIGYVAFLAGPTVIGFLGEHGGVLRALSVTGGLLAIGLMVAGSAAPLRPSTPDAP